MCILQKTKTIKSRFVGTLQLRSDLCDSDFVDFVVVTGWSVFLIPTWVTDVRLLPEVVDFAGEAFLLAADPIGLRPPYAGVLAIDLVGEVDGFTLMSLDTETFPEKNLVCGPLTTAVVAYWSKY
jgi:hypothetical protein